MEGLVKIQIKLQAFTLLNKERPTSICFELDGDMEKE